MEKEYISDGGVKIYGYKNPSSNSFFISLFLKCGSMYESDDLSGISHFLEHVAIRNVNAVMGGSLYHELDRLGLEFNASTFSEMIQFYVSGSCSHVRESIEIITKIFSKISLTSEEIEAERRRIKAEMRESDDKNSLTTFTNKIVFEGTSLASSIVGTAKTVNSITKTKLEEYRKSVFTKNNLFFYLTGNFDDSDVFTLANLVDAYGIPEGDEKKNIAPVPKGFGKRGDVFVKASDFTMIRFTFDLDMTKVSVAECDLLYDILLSGYSSKLFIEMSEKRGLFYDTSGAVERYKNIGSFYFSFEVKEKELYSAVELLSDLLCELKTELLPESECMKAAFVDNAPMLYDDSRELNFTFAYDNHIMELGYHSIEERQRAYADITSSDLRRAAREIFRKENLTITVKGNKKRIDTRKIKEMIGDRL